ncbi:MAG: hypothetical protein ACOYKC_06905 [Anaerolineaceae bacterium]
MKIVYTFTRDGLGQAPEGLQQALAVKFLSLLPQEEQLPAAILFYTEGVKLVVEGSPVINWLEMLQSKGVELIVCTNLFGILWTERPAADWQDGWHA